MKKFIVINGIGIGKSVEQKIKESENHFDVKVKIIDSQIAAYGKPEFAIIETDEIINSDFMQSIAYNTTVKEYVNE